MAWSVPKHATAHLHKRWAICEKTTNDNQYTGQRQLNHA